MIASVAALDVEVDSIEGTQTHPDLDVRPWMKDELVIVPAPSHALDLTLPRGLATQPGARNPALDDPRATTARLTPEQRLSGALDTRVLEEDLGDGRRRFRQGANCVVVSPARIAQLMPFSDAAARTPSTVSACP